MQIALPHESAMAEQHRDRNHERPLVPNAKPVRSLRKPCQRPLMGRNSKAFLPLAFLII